MRLTVLGAGPAYTDRDDAAGACYLVTAAETRLLLDLGHGAFQRIFREADPTNVAAVVISHLHPDHFIDLVPLRHYLRYEFAPPRRMRVLGPSDLAARLDALHAEPGFAAEAFDMEALDDRDHPVGSLTVRAARVAHTADSHAIRVAVGGPRARPRLQRRLRSSRRPAPAPPARRHAAQRGLVRGRAGPRRGPSPRRAGRRAARRIGRRRARPAHAPPDGPRPGGDAGLGPRRVRRTGLVRLAGDDARPLIAHTGPARGAGCRRAPRTPGTAGPGRGSCHAPARGRVSGTATGQRRRAPGTRPARSARIEDPASRSSIGRMPASPPGTSAGASSVSVAGGVTPGVRACRPCRPCRAPCPTASA